MFDTLGQIAQVEFVSRTIEVLQPHVFLIALYSLKPVQMQVSSWKLAPVGHFRQVLLMSIVDSGHSQLTLSNTKIHVAGHLQVVPFFTAPCGHGVHSPSIKIERLLQMH
jgi:hypothetical protein